MGRETCLRASTRPFGRDLVRAFSPRAVHEKKRERTPTMVLSESVRHILTAGHTAHLVTLNPDGSPQVSLDCVGLDGEEVVCAHLGTWKKVGNIQQDARVALSLETGEIKGGGVDYVVLSGL